MSISISTYKPLQQRCDVTPFAKVIDKNFSMPSPFVPLKSGTVYERLVTLDQGKFGNKDGTLSSHELLLFFLLDPDADKKFPGVDAVFNNLDKKNSDQLKHNAMVSLLNAKFSKYVQGQDLSEVEKGIVALKDYCKYSDDDFQKVLKDAAVTFIQDGIYGNTSIEPELVPQYRKTLEAIDMEPLVNIVMALGTDQMPKRVKEFEKFIRDFYLKPTPGMGKDIVYKKSYLEDKKMPAVTFSGIEEPLASKFKFFDALKKLINFTKLELVLRGGGMLSNGVKTDDITIGDIVRRYALLYTATFPRNLGVPDKILSMLLDRKGDFFGNLSSVLELDLSGSLLCDSIEEKLAQKKNIKN